MQVWVWIRARVPGGSRWRFYAGGMYIAFVWMFALRRRGGVDRGRFVGMDRGGAGMDRGGDIRDRCRFVRWFGLCLGSGVEYIYIFFY